MRTSEVHDYNFSIPAFIGVLALYKLDRLALVIGALPSFTRQVIFIWRAEEGKHLEYCLLVFLSLARENLTLRCELHKTIRPTNITYPIV